MQIKNSKYSDISLALFVVAIAVMLLIPLPTLLLDLLLAVNIGFAVLLLLVGLYIPNALSLLSFPSLLLLSTLFRLALNVASTRLILSQGDAGTVIEAFGTFLISGELVVGIIIFVIITAVNFIVIARGAGRVSEVAARFALDALPGKQMAIDSDLRAGLISAQEAQEKRESLRKESQLYGAMDGAMKFVQGDAIAGILITFTNIIGGIYLGVAHGLQFSQAISQYTTLTVGDGLVSQIPALLISICAGIVVTRVASDKVSTLGSDVGSQLFDRPALLLVTAGILITIMLMSGLPWLPFTTIALVCIWFGVSKLRQQAKTKPNFVPARDSFNPGMGIATSAGVLDYSEDESGLEFVFDEQILYSLYERRQNNYLSWWRSFQVDFYEATGLELPKLRVTYDQFLPAGAYKILKGGCIIDQGELLLDSFLVEMGPNNASMFGLRVLREEEHPLRGDRVFWTLASFGNREILTEGGIKFYDFFEYLVLKASRYLLRNPEELLSLIEVHSKLKSIEKQFPGFLSEALYNCGVSATVIGNLVHSAIKSGISIREFKSFLESIASYPELKPGSTNLDLANVLNHIRYARRRSLISSCLSPRNTIKVFTVSDSVEEVFDGCDKLDFRNILPISQKDYEDLHESLSKLIEPFRERGLLPVSLLCKRELRSLIDRFMYDFNLNLPVLCFEELDVSLPVEAVGTWAIERIYKEGV